MLEQLGLIDYSLPLLLALAGLILGVVFGATLQATRFCLRTGVIETTSRRISPMLGAYAVALLTAVIGAQALHYYEVVDLSESRFLGDSLPVGALALGGLLFGCGMVLARGCASRLLTLTAQGNLRALIASVFFAIIVYATMRGVLSEARTVFSSATSIDVGGFGALPALAGISPVAATGLIVGLLALLVLFSRISLKLLVGGVIVGAVVTAAWLTTGFILFDEFDPQPPEGVGVTASSAEALFYVMMSSAIEPGFASGILLGVLIGALASALIRGEFRLESFENPTQTLRSLIGAFLMGVGGVMAGGCTIGAGLTGVSTLAVGPMIALAGIILGAKATHLAMGAQVAPRNAAMVPAE